MNFAQQSPNNLRMLIPICACIVFMIMNHLLETTLSQQLLIVAAYVPILGLLYKSIDTRKATVAELKQVIPTSMNKVAGKEKKLIALKNEESQMERIAPQQKLQASIMDDRHSIEAGDDVVLVVEDDPFFAKLLLSNIQSRNLKGVVVNQGNLVMSYIRKYQPKAILLDINIPQVDGWTILENIKTNLQFRDIPVHIISGIDERKKGMSMGASTYLVKPVVPEKLTDVLKGIQESTQTTVQNIAIISQTPNEPSVLENMLLSSTLSHNTIRLQPDELLPTLVQKSLKIHCIILDIEDTQTKAYQEMMRALKSHTTYKNIPRITLTNGSADKVVSFFKKYTPMHQMIEQYPMLQDYLGKTNDFLRRLGS